MSQSPTQKLQHISPEDIRENPENPRLLFRQEEMESLLVSIERHGIQVPITVYKEGAHYRLIDGERRWRCARKLNLKSMPALVQDRPSELENLLLMYNIHALREQWDYFTIASSLKRVMRLYESEHGAEPNESQLSQATGLSRGQIRRCYLLLDLPERFKQQLLEELALPKSRQAISEDLLIEMERSLKTVVKRFPEYERTLDQTRDALLKKFRDGTIKAITDFRQLSKVATASDQLVSRQRVRRALDGLFDARNQQGIREAYARTVEFRYDEKKAARQVAALNEFLEELVAKGGADTLDAAFLEQLRQLQEYLAKLLRVAK